MAQQNFRKLERELRGREGIAGSAILFTVLFLFGSLFVWASWAELDNVTRGEGRIVSSLQNQLVQASEGGVILRRFVSENSVVETGDPLFEIDPIEVQSELDRLNKRLSSLELKALRLESEVSGSSLVLPDGLKHLSDGLVESELSLFAARKQELDGKISALTLQLRQNEQEYQSARSTVETAQQMAEYIRQEIMVVEPLVNEKIAPATRLLELQRQLAQSLGQVVNGKFSQEQAQLGISQTRTEIENALESFRLRAIDELNALIIERSEIEALMPGLKERVSRTVIRAPMKGIVSRLNFRTAGGFVNSGDVVLELVPTEEELIVSAKIPPQDISRIRLGDAVLIRFSAYDSAKYGAVDGRVARISADAVFEADGNGASYYMVDVEIVGSLVLADTEEAVTFIPGMTATVDVISGKRTVLQYFWEPIAKIQELALRD